MLETIYGVVVKKNVFYNQNYHDLNIFVLKKSHSSIFNELKNNLLKKARKFDTVFSNKKKDDDKNIVNTNFLINHLINILNQKDNIFDIDNNDNFKNKNIPKKKINEQDNNQVKTSIFLTNLKNFKIKTMEKKYQKNKQKKINFEWMENKNNFHKINKLEKINQMKNLYDQQNIKNLNQNDIKFIKNISSLISVKNDKCNFLSLKNTKNISYEAQFLIDKNQKNYFKSEIKSFFSNISQNIIEWKKAISQRTLLSISNKDNEAEIYLKPEHLGSVYVKIKMKNNQAKLNFTSYHNDIRLILDHYMPFLRNSLIKNGITLKEVNIDNNFFLKNKNSKINKNLFHKNIFNQLECNKIFQQDIKNVKIINYKAVDVYV